MAGRGVRLPAAVATLWRVTGERHLGLVAAGVGFFAMLALFPGLAALIALVGFWADPVVVQDSLDLAVDFIPVEAHAILVDQVSRLVRDDSRALGLASLVSLGAAVWSARLGVGALAQGLNAIYGGPPRGGLRDTLLALALTATLIGVGVISVAAMLLMPVALALVALVLPQHTALFWLAEVLRWAVSLGALVVGLGLFYRYGPNRADGRAGRFLSPGLALAIVLWAAASAGFTLFLANFGTYNEVYGSIGAVVALLMWFYISAYAVLLGGALNHALESAAEAPADQSQRG